MEISFPRNLCINLEVKFYFKIRIGLLVLVFKLCCIVFSPIFLSLLHGDGGTLAICQNGDLFLSYTSPSGCVLYLSKVHI